MKRILFIIKKISLILGVISLFCLLVSSVFIFILTGGCEMGLNRLKNKMLNAYCNDDNYISFFGEVVEISKEDTSVIIIKCVDLKKYVDSEDSKYKCIIYSNDSLSMDIGDNIYFTTIPIIFNDGQLIPIVSITINNEIILDITEGKENLINWVNQLQYK